MHISRIVHQTARDYASLPGEIRESIERLKALNPGWEYRFYDDSAMMACIGQHLGADALRLCERVDLRFKVILADLFRYTVVHAEGGVYLDIKSTAVKPLDEIVRPDDVFLLSQWRNRLGERYETYGLVRELPDVSGGAFQQWHVIAAAGHPFLKQAIGDTLRNMALYHPAAHGMGGIAIMRVSGPACYTRAIMPLLAHYRARIVDSEGSGLRYTIYDTNFGHQAEEHYMRIRAPIIHSQPDLTVPKIFLRAG